MILEQGRPQTTEGREAREVRTYDFLDTLGILSLSPVMKLFIRAR